MELSAIAPSSTYSASALDRLLTMRELTRATSLSRTTVYRMVAQGTLPPPLKIGKSRIAWRASSITRWLAERQVPSLATKQPPTLQGGTAANQFLRTLSRTS